MPRHQAGGVLAERGQAVGGDALPVERGARDHDRDQIGDGVGVRLRQAVDEVDHLQVAVEGDVTEGEAAQIARIREILEGRIVDEVAAAIGV